jgi:hypothetical protein
MGRLLEMVREGLRDPAEARRYLIESTWGFWERFGFFVVPDHYYFPIPSTEELERNRPWEGEYPTAGIDLREGSQRHLLEEFRQYVSEYEPSGGGFESNGDGPVLFAMVREFEPDRVIEVGSGSSTRVVLEASERNAADSGERTEVVAVEPYPDDDLRRLAARHDNLTLRESRAEDVDVAFYTDLEDGDFLFIDSSHVARAGNDVTHLYLKVLPQLPTGVYVHAHDIRFPSEYPREWLVDDHHFWTEQYLLQSFMSYNDSFEVVWSGNYMSEAYGERLEAILPNYESDAGWPGSFWIRRTD